MGRGRKAFNVYAATGDLNLLCFMEGFDFQTPAHDYASGLMKKGVAEIKILDAKGHEVQHIVRLVTSDGHAFYV